MACDKFETEGLLYCADELSAEQASEYETHIAQCEDCSLEVTEYREMFGGTPVGELLEEIPSPECDAKILAALEVEAVRQSKPAVSMAGFFTLFLQRVAVPAAIFLVALTITVQFTNMNSQKAASIAKTEDSTVVKKDSLSDTGRIFLQGGSNGVIPVTLEDK